MNISPLADRVVIEPIEEDETSASGIVIPDTADKEGPKKGIVRAVGPGRLVDGKRVKIEVEVDDGVFFSYPESSMKIKGKELLIVKEDNIQAKIPGFKEKK